jgi:hypothetical protein
MTRDRWTEADRDGWTVRIGAEATELIRRATATRRAGFVSLLLCVVLEIGFQLANYYRPGIEGSLIFMAGGVFGLSYAIRLMARARRVVAPRVGLSLQDAKYIRLRHGTEGFDQWLAARDQPGWPSRGWR